MVGKKKSGVSSEKTENMMISKYEKDIKNLSDQEIKELLMINMYKMALIRAQLEALTNVMIKNKMTTFEEVWKETNENFKNSI
jgi:hypothetical protein